MTIRASLPLSSQRGFTLMELLVAMAMIGFVMAGVLSLQMAGVSAFVQESNQADVQSTVRAALEQMSRETREAGYNTASLPVCTPTPTPATCLDVIINATSTSFTIQNDWNGNSAIDPSSTVTYNFSWGNVTRGERVTYSISGSNLQRQESGVDGSPKTIVSNVSQASVGGVTQPYFQYLDAGGTVLATPITNPSLNQSGIRTVVVNLQVGAQTYPAPAAGQPGSVSLTLSDRIRLRNR